MSTLHLQHSVDWHYAEQDRILDEGKLVAVAFSTVTLFYLLFQLANTFVLIVNETAIAFGGKICENIASECIGDVMLELHKGIFLNFIEKSLFILLVCQFIPKNS